MNNDSRCLYDNTFKNFINEDNNSILGSLCRKYHGEALSTTREAWDSEIAIMKQSLAE